MARQYATDQPRVGSRMIVIYKTGGNMDYTRRIAKPHTRLWVFGHRCIHNLIYGHYYKYRELTNVLGDCVYATHPLMCNSEEDYSRVCEDAGVDVAYAQHHTYNNFTPTELYNTSVAFDWGEFELADIQHSNGYVSNIWRTHFSDSVSLDQYVWTITQRHHTCRTKPS